MTVAHVSANIPIIGQSAEVTIDSPDIPLPNFKALFIAHNAKHAEEMRRQYADGTYMAEREIKEPRHGSPHVYVTYPNEILAGRRYSNVLIQSRVLESFKRDPKAWDWYQEIALCRLLPDGVVKVID